MLNRRVTRTLLAVTGAVALALLGMVLPTAADDTEIYQATYDAAAGARPKVLIVFDDSGSMDTQVQQQRPVYNSSATYATSVSANRIYWSTDGTVPATNSSNWFDASKNRCASSYDNLNDNGRYGVERARRWIDSTVQQGQCTLACPSGTEYRAASGPNIAGCYQQTTTTQPVEKLVYDRDDGNNDSCPAGLTYVDPPGNNNDACYRVDTSSNPVSGYVFRANDNNDSCSGGYSYLTVNPPGPNNTYDACFELVTPPETTPITTFTYTGPRVQVCEPNTNVPGSWGSLSATAQSPTHVECRDDVTNNNTANGAGQSSGFPQNNAINGSEYGPNVDGTIDWGNTAHTFFTSHYMNWYHDASLDATKDRLQIAQEVISTIVATNPNIDFGLVEFNRREGGRVVKRIIADMGDTERTNLIGLVNQMDHGGSTPMCESMYEAFNYIAGRPVEYGNSRDVGGDSRGRWDDLPKDPLAEASGTYISPNTDCAYTYIILMTDGEPQNDIGANQRIKDLTGKGCSNYRDADGNLTENCMPQLTEYMASTDLDGDDANGDQYGITYTIGFATDQKLLKDAAEKGKGQYYTASDAQGLTAAFQGAITGILSRATTFTSPAVTIDTFANTKTRSEVYYGMFKPAETVDWPGNVKKLKLNTDTVLVDAANNLALDPVTGNFKDSTRTFWSAAADGPDVEKGGVGELLANRDPAARTIYSNTATGGAFEIFDTTNFDAAALGLTDAQFFSLLGASDQAAAEKQINWARGADAYDIDGDGNTGESRGWKLGDILHSQPLVLNYGARGSFTTAEPDLRLLVGSNSGFVHMFADDDGQEDWAFFPKELAGILPKRRRNALSNDHVYGMDLSPVAYTYDSNKDGTLDSGDGDKVWVYLGMRMGGKAYYALDLSNPDSPSFMWRIDKNSTGFGELGQSWSEPVVTSIPGYKDSNGVSKPVLVFGAGYDTSKDAAGLGAPDVEGRGLFIVDAQTGALIWSVTPAINSAKNLSEPGLLHSVPANVTTYDSDDDKLTDRIYFGDTGGNLWRVDLPGNALPTSSQNTWQINKLAAFNGGTNATDRRIFNAPDLVRIRLGGKAIDAIIVGTGDRTNPNSTDVDDRLYLIRDKATAPYATARPTTGDCADPAVVDFRCSLPLSDSDLFDISDNTIITGTAAEKAAAITELSNADGWRFDLPNAGEKALASTSTFGGKVFAPTFTPANLLDDINSCEPQAGAGRLWVFDLYTGERTFVNLGPIIPGDLSVIITEDGGTYILLPPGMPPPSPDEEDKEPRCEGGLCDTGLKRPPPYGNYWFQEEYQ